MFKHRSVFYILAGSPIWFKHHILTLLWCCLAPTLLRSMPLWRYLASNLYECHSFGFSVRITYIKLASPRGKCLASSFYCQPQDWRLANLSIQFLHAARSIYDAK